MKPKKRARQIKRVKKRSDRRLGKTEYLPLTDEVQQRQMELVGYPSAAIFDRSGRKIYVDPAKDNPQEDVKEHEEYHAAQRGLADMLGIRMAQDPVLRKAFRQSNRNYDDTRVDDTPKEMDSGIDAANYMMDDVREYEAIFKSAMGSANERGVPLASDTLPTALSKLERLTENPETTSTNLRILKKYIADVQERGDQKEIESALAVLNATY